MPTASLARCPRIVLACALGIGLALAAGCGDGDEHLGIDATVIDAATSIDAEPDAATRQCGGFAGMTCTASEYCDYDRNSCGATDEQGTCVTRPTDCPDLLVAVPTCGCDNVVYGSECDAYAAGADLNAFGSCPVAAGSFACGYTQCNVHSQYCRRDVSDIGNEPDTYSCQTVPACPSQFPTCACLAAEPCGAMCSGAGVTGLTLTCPGG